MKNKNLLNFIKSLLSGIIVGLAGTSYIFLYANNKILGSVLFSFALLLIVFLNLNLYTGKIGYVFDKKIENKPNIFLVLGGNVLGLLAMIIITRLSYGDNYAVIANQMVSIKIESSYINILFKAVLCGFMMYIAVEGYKRIENNFGRVLIVILSIMIFILAGFEHSIANFYYFGVALYINLKVILAFLLMLVGNAVGAIALHYLFRLVVSEKETKNKI